MSLQLVGAAVPMTTVAMTSSGRAVVSNNTVACVGQHSKQGCDVRASTAAPSSYRGAHSIEPVFKHQAVRKRAGDALCLLSIHVKHAAAVCKPTTPPGGVRKNNVAIQQLCTLPESTTRFRNAAPQPPPAAACMGRRRHTNRQYGRIDRRRTTVMAVRRRLYQSGTKSLRLWLGLQLCVGAVAKVGVPVTCLEICWIACQP